MPDFIPPPEAPVFEPNREEFKDPLAYIAKIRPIAEKSGICKIRPPSDWRPPFSVNVPQFRFTPRVQRLNELEATTRVKLNFLDAVAKYWELQGTTMRLPTVEGSPLDLLKLWKVVEEEGGFQQAVKEKRWTQIASKMGLSRWQALGSTMRSHYEKILFPYSVFKATQLQENKAKSERRRKLSTSTTREVKSEGQSTRVRGSGSTSADGDTTWSSERKTSSSFANRPSCTVGEATPGASTLGSSVTTRRSRRMAGGVDPLLSAALSPPNGARDKRSRELQRLQFLSPGPKILDSEKSEEKKVKDEQVVGAVKPLEPVTKEDGSLDVDSIVCYSCRHGDGEDCMLLCDVCNASYHTYCLVPPLRTVPAGDWRCPPCVAKECSKPQEAFGFEQADKVYSLHTFQTFANRFKGDYFGTAPHLVPMGDVEQEFWRLVHSIEDDVAVEYGADLHSSEHGSGFPLGHFEDELHQFYSESGWNLNNLPNLEASVLRHITADISGMKVPWLYVGMCFSSFCWHNEDHWSYSINYLHWGEPKTWYGVPGASSAKFEVAMRATVPELFNENPDLLHHLVTLISPNVLMKHDIPVVRTNQHAGEFVVTFPRAYHAGFNQGYNFAEAVNFCPADWVPHGRSCMAHYRQLHRYTVFAHDELVCKMAMLVNDLDVQMAAELYKDMVVMVEHEKRLREKVAELGVTESEREAFELLPDDERQCRHCQALCFLSAVTCPCSPGKLVCLEHVEKLCACPVDKTCLRYRYTLSELPAMLLEVENRAQGFTLWEDHVRTALNATGDARPTVADLKALLREAAEARFASDLLTSMEHAIAEADRCNAVAAQLISVRPRTRHKTSDHLISKDELDDFVSQVEKLTCRIQCDQLMSLCSAVTTLEEASHSAIERESSDLVLIDSLLKEACSATIEIKSLPQLETCWQQAKWMDAACSLTSQVPLLLAVEQHVKAANDLPVRQDMAELLGTLCKVRESGIEFESRLQSILSSRTTVHALEGAVNEAKLIPVVVPSLADVHATLKLITQWTKDANTFLNASEKLDAEQLNSLLSRAQTLNVDLEEVSRLQKVQRDVNSWRERLKMFTSSTESVHSSNYVVALYPRTDIINRLDSRHKPVNIMQRRRGLKSSEEEVALIFELAGMEQDHMRQVRAQFIKQYYHDCRSSTPVVHGLYCHCRRPLADCMLRCELCLNYYHRDCLLKNELPDRYGRFLCAKCNCKSKPSLSQVGQLYADLRNIKVVVPEAVALRVLLQRAILWQIQVRYSLSSALDMFERKMATQAKQLRSIGIRSFAPSPSEMDKMMRIVTSSSSASSASGHGSLEFEKRAVDTFVQIPGLRSLDMHVVEMLRTQQPPAVLSAQSCAHFEELMLQGDLLAVSLDEVNHVWSVLKANHQQMNNIRVQPRSPAVSLPLKRVFNGDHDSTAGENRRKKKKRSSGDSSGAVTPASDVSDEVCEARQCLRPSKRCLEVEWVQCDDCNLWYHLLCIDLPPDVAHSVEKYSCFRCADKSKLSSTAPAYDRMPGSQRIPSHPLSC